MNPGSHLTNLPIIMSKKGWVRYERRPTSIYTPTATLYILNIKVSHAHRILSRRPQPRTAVSGSASPLAGRSRPEERARAVALSQAHTTQRYHVISAPSHLRPVISAPPQVPVRSCPPPAAHRLGKCRQWSLKVMVYNSSSASNTYLQITVT